MSNHHILNFADQGNLRVHNGAGAGLGDAVMASLAIPIEFRAVQAHYPIVFRRDISTGLFSTLAMFGFDNGENLFLDGDTWDARYRPLAHAIQPFLIGRPASDGEIAQVHVDMDHPRIASNGEGMRVFDDDGRPSPFMETMASKLADLDAGYRQMPEFCATLDRMELLEPFTLEVPLSDGSRHSLVGYHIIAEERMASLDGATLGELQAKGYLLPIFMAVASLSRFNDLVARKNARLTLG